MGFSLSSIIGSTAGAVVSSVATPFADAWVKTKESAAATHKIDKETDRDITVASFTADIELAKTQRLLAEADSTHWSTRWIRPAFTFVVFVYFAAVTLHAIGIIGPVAEMPYPWNYLASGIVGAIFLLRPLEKNKRADIVAKAQPSMNVLSTVTAKLRARPDREAG